MQSNNYNNLQSYGKKYLQERRFNNRVAKIKTIALHVVTLLACISLIGVFYYPVVKDVFAADLEEEPAIPQPAQVEKLELAKEVRVKVVIEWTEERIVEEIHKVFPDAPYMEDVARCEGSRGGLLDPTAFNPTNGSNDKGIFQISEYWQGDHYRSHGFTDMKDPAQNIAFARILFDIGGLSDWEASRHCWS